MLLGYGLRNRTSLRMAWYVIACFGLAYNDSIMISGNLTYKKKFDFNAILREPIFQTTGHKIKMYDIAL